MCGPNCACPNAAVSYVGWNGSVESFEIVSRFFAYELILANPRKALNVPYDVQADLQRYAAQKYVQHVQVVESAPSRPLLEPARAASPPQSQEEQDVLSTLAQLESLKGPVSRRNTVEAALARIQDPRLRQRLMVEAARIEVHAVLDKVDTLKTASAKRRHLEAALQQIRNDPVPDELQTEEIDALENALRALPRE